MLKNVYLKQNAKKTKTHLSQIENISATTAQMVPPTYSNRCEPIPPILGITTPSSLLETTWSLRRTRRATSLVT